MASRDEGAAAPPHGSEGVDLELNLRWLLRLVTATRTRRLVLGLLVLLPAVVAALGGFRTVVLETVETAAPGEVVNVGEYTLATESFFVAGGSTAPLLPDGATGWVGFVAEIVDTQDYAIYPGQLGEFALPGLEPIGAARILLLPDAVLTAQVQPGLPATVVVLFAVADPTAVGDELLVEITPRALSYGFLSDREVWLSSDRLVDLTLPIGEVPAGVQEEP